MGILAKSLLLGKAQHSSLMQVPCKAREHALPLGIRTPSRILLDGVMAAPLTLDQLV